MIITMAVLQVAIFFVISFELVLTQSYRLIVRDVSPIVLSCRDNSTGIFADIDEVKFWRNRTLPIDPGLREKGDMPVFEDRVENSIAFTLTRIFEGYYTCGRQQMDAVQESPPLFLVSRQTLSPRDPYENVSYAIPWNQAVLHCPIQPGALIQYYYGRWERNGYTLVEITQPINRNPGDIVQSDSRYNIDRTTFSLTINSVEPSDADNNYQCFLSVIDPLSDLPIYLQTGIARITLMVNAEPEILSRVQVKNGITVQSSPSSQSLSDEFIDQLPSFTCVAAGLPPPTIIWTYVPNLDQSHEISLSDGDKYQVVNNISKKDDGRQVTTSSVTFLKLTATDGGLVRCKASSPIAATTADAFLTVIGRPDHIDVLVSTKGEFIYDVALPVLLQYPVKLNISYVDKTHQFASPGRLTTTEYNDTSSILYREMDTGQLPFEKYFVRISIVAEFENKRIEGPPLTSSEFIDTTKPYAEVVIFGLSGGVATTLLIILVILPCVTAIGCCVYHHRKGCRGGLSYCHVSEKSTVV